MANKAPERQPPLYITSMIYKGDDPAESPLTSSYHFTSPETLQRFLQDFANPHAYFFDYEGKDITKQLRSPAFSDFFHFVEMMKKNRLAQERIEAIDRMNDPVVAYERFLNDPNKS